MITAIALSAALQLTNPGVTESPAEKILGQWKGIEMFQDQDSYDGETFYLPNSEELVIDKNRFKVYFYPYFKTDEFEAVVTSKSVVYSIGKKKVKSEYHFIGDTLVMSMNFINKTFIKMYQRTSFDPATVLELDEFGFNPSSLVHEFELDTFHAELKRGFKYFDSLGFDVLQHIQFTDDTHFKLNRSTAIGFTRGYQSVKYMSNGTEEEFRIYKITGTQQFSIIPYSQCQCDSIHIPYMVVSWAERMRRKVYQDRGVY